jgi:hypothetical protein
VADLALARGSKREGFAIFCPRPEVLLQDSVRVVPTNHSEAELMRVFFESLRFTTHDFGPVQQLLARPEKTFTIDSAFGTEYVRRTATYNEVWTPYAMQEQALALLDGPPGSTGFLCWTRSARMKPFDAEDLVAFEAARAARTRKRLSSGHDASPELTDRILREKVAELSLTGAKCVFSERCGEMGTHARADEAVPASYAAHNATAPRSSSKPVIRRAGCVDAHVRICGGPGRVTVWRSPRSTRLLLEGRDGAVLVTAKLDGVCTASPRRAGAAPRARKALSLDGDRAGVGKEVIVAPPLCIVIVR